jgi:hypothetical protein
VSADLSGVKIERCRPDFYPVDTTIAGKITKASRRKLMSSPLEKCDKR